MDIPSGMSCEGAERTTWSLRREMDDRNGKVQAKDGQASCLGFASQTSHSPVEPIKTWLMLKLV